MATNAPKAQLQAEFDASGTRAGFEQIKRDAAQTGKALEQAGKQGDAAFKAIDDAAKATATSMSRTEAGILGSITRAANRLQNAGKSASEAFAIKIDTKGLDPAKFEPALAQLRKAEAGAKAFADAQAESARRAREEAAALADSARAQQQQEAARQRFLGTLREQIELQGKSQAEVLRYRAAQLGVGADAEKYIGAIEKQSVATGKLGVSAGQTAAALRQLPAQFTDIFTSLASGQAPLTVFLQQGGQIKDSFGGIGPALRETAKAALGLINPFTVAAGAVGLIALAYKAGADESDRFARTLILSGNAIGTTSDALGTAAAKLATFGTTQGKAADVLDAFVNTGKVGSAVLERFTAAAIGLERAGGPAVEKTVAAFASLGDEPYKASVKLNESTNFLTASVLRQIKTLEDQGKATEASRVAQNAYASAIEQRAPELEARLGLVEKAWRGIGDAAKAAWDGIKNIGRDNTLQQQLADIERAIDAVEKARQRASNSAPALGSRISSTSQADAAAAKRTAELRAQADAIREQIRLADRAAQQDAERGRLAQVMVRGLADEEKYIGGSLVMQRELNRVRDEGAKLVAAGLRSEATQREIIAGIIKKYSDTGATNELESLKAKVKQTKDYIQQLSVQGQLTRELNEGETKAAQIREQLKGNISAQTRELLKQQLVEADKLGLLLQQKDAVKKSIDDYVRLTDSVGQQADAIRQQAIQLEAANAAMGQGKTAVEELTLAELKKQAAELEELGGVAPKYLANLNAKIDAQERFVKALKAADYKQLNQGLDEWLRSATESKALFEDEQQLAGLTRLEREKALAARQVELKLAKEIAKIDQSSLDESEKEALRAKARQAAQIESSAAVAKVVRDDWAKTADQIEEAITDALMRGFESGKSVAANVRDAIVNLFKTLVLRPTIQAIIQPSAASITGLSSSNSLGASVGGIGNLGSLFGMQGLGGSFGSAFSGGTALGGDAIGAGWTALMNGSGTVAGNVGQMLGGLNGSLSGLGGIGGTLGYASAIYSLSQGKYGSAAGTAIGTAFGGPIGAAIGSAIGSALDKVFSGGAGTPHRGSIVTGDSAGVRTGGYDPNNILGHFEASTDTALKTITTNALALLNGTAASFGKTGAYSAEAYFTADGKDPTFAGLKLARDGSQIATTGYTDGKNQYSNDATAAFTAYTADAAKAVRDALESIGLPEWAKQSLDALGDAPSFDQLNQAVANITATRDALKSLGDALPQIGNLSDAAVAALLKAAGGIDNLKSSANAYYENFYSSAEKTATASRALSEALGQLGITMPATREAYRALVEAQDLNTDAGRAAYAQLLQLAPAFAALVPATQDLSQASNDAADSVAQAAAKMAEAGRKVLADLASQQGDLQVQLLRAQGDVTAAAALERQQAIAKLTEGLSASDAAAAIAAYDLNAALKAQVDATNAAATAAQQAAQAEAQRQQAIANERAGLQNQLDQLLGNTAAIRERELAALDPANRELQERLYKLQDEQAAQQAAAQAAAEAAQQAAQLREAWQSVGNSIADEIKRIRGLADGGSQMSLADAQARFAIATAQARAGDQDAARSLPALSQAIEQIARQQATSAAELRLINAQTAASLAATLRALGQSFGFDVPKLATGTNMVPSEMLAVLHPGEAVVPREYNPAAGGGLPGTDVVAELRALRADQRAQAQAIVNLQLDVKRLLSNWNAQGMPPVRNETIGAGA